MFGIFKRKNKNKDIDPVKEKQKLVNDSIKNSKKEKKKKNRRCLRSPPIDILEFVMLLLYNTLNKEVSIWVMSISGRKRNKLNN